MLTSMIALLALGGPQPPLCCPNIHTPIEGKPAVTLEYCGALFGTCCNICSRFFIKDPKDALARAIKFGKTIAAFEYDPLTGLRIDGAKAEEFSDYKAIRYFFTSIGEKKSFDANPGKFVGDVKAEAYCCPDRKEATTSMPPGGYVDYKQIRYFFCDKECVAAFRSNPAKFAASVAEVKELVPKVIHS
jgi:YHS domain-containing protein